MNGLQHSKLEFRTMKKQYVIAASLMLLPAITAFAASENPAFKQRHQNFEAMGKAMKGIFDEFKKPAASLAVIKTNSAILAQSSKRVAGHFPKGTGPESGVKTDALPAIWAKPADFKAAADRLVTASAGLQVAAATGDMTKIKAAAGAVGGSCKGCHDSFRKPKD
jgi:cytochrome c556